MKCLIVINDLVFLSSPVCTVAKTYDKLILYRRNYLNHVNTSKSLFLSSCRFFLSISALRISIDYGLKSNYQNII